MADPSFASVQTGKGKIRGATAKQKKNYRSGESRIGLSQGRHSDPASSSIVNEAVAAERAGGAAQPAFPQSRGESPLAWFLALDEDVASFLVFCDQVFRDRDTPALRVGGEAAPAEDATLHAAL
jgi:hypothetical protein